VFCLPTAARPGRKWWEQSRAAICGSTTISFAAASARLDAEGAGIVSIRATERKESTWVPPLSLHAEAVREQRVGQVFNTITNGVRNMPPYGSLIPVHDRWAIVLYVQALQRSQSTSVDELPTDLRDKLPQ